MTITGEPAAGAYRDRVQMTLSQLAVALDGRLVGSDGVVQGVSIDSRELVPGQMFVALVAERDGHDFVGAACERGARACLVSRPVGVAPEVSVVEVPDTATALQDLGRFARDELAHAAVVGITGSVGKTSTKDLLAAILSQAGVTAASERSFNNEIGLPLTLANAPADCRFVVTEMGARGLGHIALLASIARPTVGVVTAVAEVHTELFGTLDDVARGKGELIELLPSSGTAVLNVEDRRVAAMANRTDASICRVALAAGPYAGGADVTYEVVSMDADLRPIVRLVIGGQEITVRLGVAGAHQAGNAALAAGAAARLGARLADIEAGLASATLSPWRMAVARAASGRIVVNDAYNASPTSMRAALDSLLNLTASRRVAVLGPMAELGDDGDQRHRDVAEYATERGITVIAVGTDAYGIDPLPHDEAVSTVDSLGPDVAVLVKASRVAAFERLAARLLER